MKSLSATLVLSALASMAAARTDLSGCTSSATVDQWNEASMIWYVPGTGEICAFLDCGGGRAPPRNDVAGCPLYTGTASYEPSYLPGNGPGATTAPSTSAIQYSTITTKCSLTKTTSTSRPLITPGPSAPGSVASSSPAQSAPVTTAGTEGSASPSTPPVSGNGASVFGYSAAGAMIAVAAFMGVAL